MVNLETLNYEKLITVERIGFLYYDEVAKKAKPVKSLISPMSEPERLIILNYLKSGIVCEAAPGIWYDEISGEQMPLNTMVKLTDGVYIWKFQTMYYFEHYGIQLPDEFVEHILNQNEKVKYKN